MKDVATTTGTTVTGSAIEQLLFTGNSRTGVRGLAHATITDRASYAYDLAHGLSGGGEVHTDAHAAGLTNLLHTTAPAVVAFALHHLGDLLPDLTGAQWARIDAPSSLPALGGLFTAEGTGPFTANAELRYVRGAQEGRWRRGALANLGRWWL
jgi:hypothetical protein